MLAGEGIVYNGISFMNKNTSSVDGFIPRRPGTQLGSLHDEKPARKRTQTSTTRSLQTSGSTVVSADTVGQPRRGRVIGRDDIDESLREIDNLEPENGKKPKKGRRKDRKANKPKSKARRIVFWVSMALLAILVGVGGFLAFKAITATQTVFQGSVLDLIQNEPLKEDANGRSNFLVFGTAEDDEGGEHGGANLTDSIMVISVDQDKKNAYMLSLPRDLWVQYQETCTVGNQGKLNAAYFCASNDGEDEQAGAEALMAKVGEITGLEMQYYVHLNFTAVVQAVDAVGGVDVTIQSEDPRGILDRNFDWKCNYTCYYVNYKNGQQAHLDGERALALARARNAAGGYGLPNGNFDREKNQQMIIKALRDKALSVGTLTNVGAVTGLIDALGNNLRTNIQTKEIRTLMDVASKTTDENIISLSLNEEGNMLVTTGSYNGQSIVRPVAGLLDYSQIHAYVQKSTSSDPFVKEEPHVTVLNGSGEAGVAQRLADQLEDRGFVIDAVDNAPDGTYQAIEIYQINKEKTATAAKLKELYKVTLKTTTPPVSVVGETDFVIIIGSASAVPAE